MGRSSSNINKTTVKRVMAGARAAGFEIVEILIHPDTTVRLVGNSSPTQENYLDKSEDIFARLNEAQSGKH